MRSYLNPSGQFNGKHWCWSLNTKRIEWDTFLSVSINFLIQRSSLLLTLLCTFELCLFSLYKRETRPHLYSSHSRWLCFRLQRYRSSICSACKNISLLADGGFLYDDERIFYFASCESDHTVIDRIQRHSCRHCRRQQHELIGEMGGTLSMEII